MNRFGVLAAAVGVLLWRWGAWVRPSSMIEIPEALRLPLALLGVLFLVCGVAAWWIRPGRWTGVLLLFCLGGCVHWGGAIGGATPAIELGLVFVYLACTLVGEAALLHLAWIYPSPETTLPRGARFVLYGPAGVALVLAVMAGVLPSAVLRGSAVLLMGLGALLSLAGGVLFLIRMFLVDRATRGAARLPLIVAGLVVGSVIGWLGGWGVLPGPADAWNLAIGLIPVCLAIALVTQTVEDRRPEPGGGPAR